MAELIQRTDDLNTGREKLNEAIKDADKAKIDAEQALNTANEALSQSESTQIQLNQVVIDGDSSVEAAQARVDAEGKSYPTLKARLDAKETEFSSQLAQNKTSILELKNKVPDNFGLLSLEEHPYAKNPVISASDVTDLENVRFVADPFIVYENGVYHMFFEVYVEDGVNNVGHIGHAISYDGVKYKYDRIVLSDGQHFAYPNVFKLADGNWYMLPDRGGRVQGLKLYRATNFPYDWVVDTVLFEDGVHIDPTPVYWKGKWYLFTYGNRNTNLFYADDIKSTTWEEHPMNPVFTGLNLRPGGNALIDDDFIDLIMQDGTSGSYGEKAFLYRISELTPTSITANRIDKPIIEANRNGEWNTDGMHHVSPVFTNKNSLPVIAVDGYNSLTREWSIGIYTVGTSKVPTVFRGVRQTPVSIQNGSWTKVPLNYVSNDTKRKYDNINHKYIIPESGYYLISLQFAIEPPAGIATNTRILVNGNEVRTSPRPISASGRQAIYLNDVFLLKENDEIEIEFYHNHTSSINIVSAGRGTWFSVVKV